MSKKRILVLCPSPQGTNPGQRLKYEQYFSSWESAGFEVVTSPFQTDRFWKIIYHPGYFIEKVFWTFWGYVRRIFDLFRVPFYDGVYIFLWVTPLGPPIMEYIVSKLAKHLIYDIDDMVFLGDTSSVNSWVSKFKGTKKMGVLMKNADYVVVCTPKLDEYVAQFNSKRIDISSTFDTNRFVAIDDYSKKEVTTIGWTGSHSTVKYLHLLDNVFRTVAKLRKIRLVVISNSTYTCEGVDVTNIPWSEVNEINDLHKIDIGVYPIPKNEWVLGKSGCKAITYMSCAIPAIATAYGTNFRVIQNNVDGFLVDTDEEWVSTIIKLIDDQELRKQIGKKGREKVINEFSVKANEGKYLAVLNDVFN
jgi:glycosyltransferase involved in cell wall biosynthesis